MSVVIKGMQMPDNCSECKLEYDQMLCPIVGYWYEQSYLDIGFDSSKDRLPECPLVELPEHHGRLIDAEYLKEHLYACATNGRPLHRMYQELDELLEAINDIPTVIEAE